MAKLNHMNTHTCIPILILNAHYLHVQNPFINRFEPARYAIIITSQRGCEKEKHCVRRN